MNYAILWLDGILHYSTPILGKSMIEYCLENLKEASFQNIICVLGNKKYECSLSSNRHYIFSKEINDVTIIPNDVEDILFLSVHFPFLTTKSINQLFQEHIQNKNEVTIGRIRLDSHVQYDRVIMEQKSGYAGCMCINREVLIPFLSKVEKIKKLKELSFFDLMEMISLKNKIGSFEIKASFEATEIKNLYILSIAEEELKKRILQKHLLSGVHIENGNTVIIGPDVSFLGEAHIFSGSILLGKTIIHPNVVVGPNSEIVDSVIYDSAKVMHSVIYNSSVGKNTTIGPFAHIRNQSSIGENNRIGNFVEFKNTTTGYKTYASHLAYVGDTECGSGVNFGCGIITVNYDGVDKHKTVIGNNVFIGCNSNLIAPIEIGSNSYIAAGSTITSNLVAGDFAIARSKQITKSNYANKFHYKRVDEE